MTFGEKLRQERESRNAALEDIAGTTKIGIRYLEALEKGDLEALPGYAFGKFYIRAYAEVLGFDPTQLIEDYERETQERNPDGIPAAVRFQPSRPPTPAGVIDDGAPAGEDVYALPAVEAPAAGPLASLSGLRLPAAAALLVVVAIGVYFIFFRGGSTESPDSPQQADPAPVATVIPEAPTPAAEPEEAAQPVAQVETQAPAPPAEARPEPRPEVTPPPREQPQPVTPTPPPSAEPVEQIEQLEPADEEVATTSSLSVSDFGVGRGVASRQLQGETDRFEEGQAAWFFTRVMGGRSGEQIRHVWLREGSVVQSIRLKLGGSHWRTHSKKTLWGTGNWAVEARDADGNVLARSTFTCVPRGS